MASKKPSTAKTKQLPKQKSRRGLLIFLALLAVFVLVAWWFTRNTSIYSRDPVKVQADIQAILDEVNLPGTVVYNKISDDGCSDRSSVGLALYVYCGHTAHKLFSNSHNFKTDLDAVDGILLQKGFKRSFDQLPSEEYDTALHGGHRSVWLRYTSPNDDEKIEVLLEYYQSPSSENDVQIGDLIKAGLAPSPAGADYLYGIHVRSLYFSCRHESLFQQPCPTPPGELNKAP